MAWILTKYLVTAGLVVLISEVAKRSDKLGALIAALPLVTVLTLFWLYFENQPSEKIANHAFYTFWYVLPTLPMFLVFPWLLGRFGFLGAIGLSVVLTVICFVGFSYLVRSLGIDLLG
jgi:F0F1-type ATP synthase assembly protein I